MRDIMISSRPRRSSPIRGCQGQSGIALMEALVSMVIFSLGLLGLIGLQTVAMNFSGNAEDRNRASLFANDIASSMWLSGTVTVSSTQMDQWTSAVADPTKNGLPNGTLTITTVAGTPNSADITIGWTPTSSTTSDKLTTRVILP